MSRSGYSSDLDNWDLIRWRGRVASAMRGKRGQRLLLDMLAALDALPNKRLIAGDFERDGEYCALGALGHMKHMDLSTVDPEEPEEVAAAFDIATPLAQEVVFMNDEAGFYNETPEQRYSRMREWLVKHIKP